MEEEKSGKYSVQGKGMRNKNTVPDVKTIGDTQKILDSIEMLKKMETIDTQKALVKVKNRLDYSRKGKWIQVVQRAAAILLLPLLTFSIWQYSQINNFNHAIAQNSITTPPTLRSVFTLPDGTKVWLNGNTTITYPTFFKGKERLVELNGEAYFKVAHNKQQPFIVNIGKIFIEAVGTEFNCMAYNDDNKNETLLTEGKVNILLKGMKGRKTVATLSPNEMVVFDNNQQHFNIRKVDPTKYIAWKKGQIIFKNDALSDVFQRLERWYNVEFVYDDNLKKDYAFTGSFEGEELTQILNYIELTTPVRFEVLKSVKDNEELYRKTEIKIKQK